MKSTELPVLYHQGSNGSIYSWRVWTEGPNIVTEYGMVDGQKQEARKAAAPKNVGRANQTSGSEQALLEAQAMWQKKRDRKYAMTPDAAIQELVRPMLAHDYQKRMYKLAADAWPAYTQPKLDGVRALAYWDETGELQVISRSGKSWLAIGSIDHIEDQLMDLLEDEPDLKNFAIDGEIYAHGETFQETTRLIKKYREGRSETLVFHVYDVIDRNNMDLGFSDRIQNLFWFGDVAHSADSIDRVHTEIVNDHTDLMRMQGNFLAEGYEGAMLRLSVGGYQWGARSYELLKVKTFQDAEFEIVGFTNGVGRFEDAVVWTCRNDLTSDTFQVVPKGTMEERAEMLANAEDYVGRQLTVRFFERSEGNIPRFPVGVGVRLDKDQP